jgi:hypothetical protein
MTNKPQGFLGRFLKATKRVILGRSDPSYLAKLVGGERFFDEAIAAQLSCSGVESQRGHPSIDPVDEASKESFPGSPGHRRIFRPPAKVGEGLRPVRKLVVD